MDISNFMSWWVNQVVNIFSQLFNILNSITFGGTSLLQVIVAIVIISALIPIIMTIAPSGNYGRGEKAGIRERKREEKNDKKYRRDK